MTEIVGISVIQAAEGIGALLAVTLLWVIVQGMRGKSTFTLSKGDGKPPAEISSATIHPESCNCGQCRRMLTA